MEGSVNDSWQNFKQLLWKLMDDYIPVKNISSSSKTKKPIWMTKKAFRLVQNFRGRISFLVNIKIFNIYLLRHLQRQLANDH